MPRVLITQGYTDYTLNRIVKKDEEFVVSEQRANTLVISGVAEIISEDVSDYRAKIAELETKNTAIKTENFELKSKIAELETKKK